MTKQSIYHGSLVVWKELPSGEVEAVHSHEGVFTYKLGGDNLHVTFTQTTNVSK